MQITTTDQLAATEATADAIVRLIGLDMLVEDSEIDEADGVKYFFCDENVLIISHELTVTLTDTEGNAVPVTYYTSADELRALTFIVNAGTVEMYQSGTYIASETI